MTTVKVLVDSVGDYNAGDIVHDAPPGLIHMAEAGTVNAATGERIAEIVDGESHDDLKDLKAKAKDLKIPGYGKMSADQLEEAIAAAEAANGGGDGGK